MNALDELRATLEARSGGFSPSEGRLAADLIEHPDQWGYQPSTVLAERVGVHRSTIVRFAQRAGFEGYPEMQRAVREAYLSSMAAAPELVLTDTTPAEGAVVSAVFQRELSNLQQSYRSLSLDTLERTAEGLAGAERVIVFGRRFSHPIAQYLSLALRTMRPGVDVAPDPGGTSIDRLFDLGAQDYALVVSLRRYSPEVQRVLASPPRGRGAAYGADRYQPRGRRARRCARAARQRRQQQACWTPTPRSRASATCCSRWSRAPCRGPRRASRRWSGPGGPSAWIRRCRSRTRAPEGLRQRARGAQRSPRARARALAVETSQRNGSPYAGAAG